MNELRAFICLCRGLVIFGANCLSPTQMGFCAGKKDRQPVKTIFMPAIDKTKIIEAIRQTDDERILFAINRLLQIEEDEIPEWHKEIVAQRLEDIEEGRAVFHSWDEVKKEIFGK